MVGFADEVWFSRLAQPALHAWTAGGRLRLATHAADRILDTDAFGFTSASWWGVGIGAIAFLFWAWLFVSRRRTKKQLATLKAGTADAGRSA